jgi:hypothetical protein
MRNPQTGVGPQLIAALAADSTLTAKALSEKFGVSRQRVYQLLKASGLKTGNPYLIYRPRQAASPCPRLLTGGVPVRISHSAAGTVSEMLVAADLLARGWHVFFPLVRTTRHDLIATSRDGCRLLRIEVRSGIRRRGAVLFAKKENAACDHYGVVVTGEPTFYQPDLPVP